MKKIVTMMMTAVMAATILLAGCGAGETASVTSTETVSSITSTEVSVMADDPIEPDEDYIIRVGSLKGPTTIGLVNLMNWADNQNGGALYDFTMATAADEITTALVKGELDIALIPANVASVLYNKTEGAVSVININTLGVLYMVTGRDDISEPSDLAGKTVYLTGKGTTPDYVLQFVLKENGLSDSVTLEYKSEATEVAAILNENTDAIGLIPQPFVTATCAKNDALKVVMSMEEEWNKIVGDSGSRLVTGVTVARNDFIENHPDELAAFLKYHSESARVANEDLEQTARYTVEREIIAAEGIAKKAIPACNVVCIRNDEMKAALEGYLNVLYESNPASVGGNLPDENFYFIEK